MRADEIMLLQNAFAFLLLWLKGDYLSTNGLIEEENASNNGLNSRSV